MTSFFALLLMKQTGFDPARLAAIPARMRSFVESRQVAGTVVLVQRHGKTVLLDAQGYANLEERRPMKPDTIFQVMSMTKPVTAIAVVMCAERGLLNLDDPVEKYLPSFKALRVKDGNATRDPKRKLTIRHLLTHTGGLGGIDPGGLDDDAKRKLPLGTYADLIPTEPLNRDPGVAMEYSGLGFSTLGRIVEIASGQSFEGFLGQNVFGPLGMKDTSFFADPKDYPRIAITYVGGMKTIEPDPYRRGAKLANPAGGLYSTAQDMATLLRCIAEGGTLRGHRILSPAAVEAMTTVQTGDLPVDGGDAQGVGLGFFVVKSPSGQTSLKPIGTFGHTGAFGTEFWADRKRGIVAVFVTQGLDNASPVRRTFNTMVNAAFVGP
ncbi:class A beta-lactamase-related serine hydrolase [bacterium]|nr:MAG: class A beta-lactamase-related serine hydrolase [bacterium]